VKRNPRTAWRQYGDQVMVITPDDRRVHQLNETASFLWNAVGEGEVEAPHLCEQLVKHFEVDPGRAKKDVTRFVNKMVGISVFEEA